jgi:hypothetical protein
LQIQKQEFDRCKHIRVNGVRCGSPSLREKPFCYYHNRARKLHVAPVVPILEDANALQFALSEVLQAIQDDQIDLKKAAAMVYTLQVAAYNLKNGVNFEPYAPNVVLTDPAEQFFAEAMKKLPENASVEQVVKVMNTAAKG